MTQGWTRTAKLRQYTRKITTVASNFSQYLALPLRNSADYQAGRCAHAVAIFLRHVGQHCIRHVAAHYASSKSGADPSLSDEVKEVPQLPIGLYQDSISEHASMNPRGEAWTMPADPLPYREPVHKGPASGACQLYDHLKPLSDFDNRDRVRNHGWNEHNQNRSFSKRIKRKQRKAVVDESTKAKRESIALYCIANSHDSRESNIRIVSALCVNSPCARNDLRLTILLITSH